MLDSGTEGERFIRFIQELGGLLGGHPYSANAFEGFTVPENEKAFSHGPAELVELDRAELEGAAKDHLDYAVMLIESATTFSQFFERRICWQFISPVRKRIATILRDLICFEGQRCEHGNAIDIRLTHQGLAELVVAARPIVSAELAQMRDEGVISYTRSHFCVESLDRLKLITGKLRPTSTPTHHPKVLRDLRSLVAMPRGVNVNSVSLGTLHHRALRLFP